MAGFAFLAFLPFVLVIFLMAGVAVCLQLDLIQIPFVAADAFRVMVLSEQRILGLLVVVEDNFFPALFVMTGFALGPKIPLVLIVFLVARQAIHLELVPVNIAFVASNALDVVVLPKQRESGFLVMIEWDLFPAALDMARFALRPEFALVLVVFFVTRNAGGLRLFLV